MAQSEISCIAKYFIHQWTIDRLNKQIDNLKLFVSSDTLLKSRSRLLSIRNKFIYWENDMQNIKKVHELLCLLEFHCKIFISELEHECKLFTINNDYITPITIHEHIKSLYFNLDQFYNNKCCIEEIMNRLKIQY